MIPGQRKPLPPRPSPEDAQMQWLTHLDRCSQCRLDSGYCDTGRDVLRVTANSARQR